MTLYLLAFLGGALTVLSPCILPVLPFVFARTGQPFHRGSGPLLMGMALGFAVVASLASVAGAWAVQFNQAGRFVALAALAVFAAALVWPRLAALLGRPLVALGERLSRRGRDGTRLGSVLLGVATGLIWSPCAGPILGLVLSGAALAGPSVHSSLLLLAYAGGATLMLAGVLRLGTRATAPLMARLAGHEMPRRVLGAGMLAGVLAVATGLDTGVLARLSASADGSGVEVRLLQLVAGRAEAAQATQATEPGAPRPQRSGLPIESVRPSFDGASNWLNTAAAPTLPSLRGKVVLVNFWTYSCINCLRTLPYVKAWAQKYADQGLVVVGVHTPEFAFEKDAANVQRAVRDLKLGYPVAQDNDFRIWRAFDNQYWPALYFIDAQGRVRHHQFGEGGAAQSERVIQALLREAGAQAPGAGDATPDTRGVGLAADAAQLRSPETYLGYDKGNGPRVAGSVVADRPQPYQPRALALNTWSLAGEWTLRPEFAEASRADARLALRFHARDANLVLGAPPAAGPLRFRLTLDGKPPGADHGSDVDADGNGVIDATRLYQLVRQQGTVDDRTVEIQFLAPGGRAYAFTFG